MRRGIASQKRCRGSCRHRGGTSLAIKKLLKISRTSFYACRTGKPGPRAVHDAELTNQIAAVHQHSRGTYGAPRIHAALQRKGVGCGRRRVARLMRAAGLQGRHRRRRHLTTIPDPRAAFRPDLVLRDFTPDPTAIPLARRHHIHSDRRGLALPGHRHRHRLPPRGQLGDRRTSADTASCWARAGTAMAWASSESRCNCRWAEAPVHNTLANRPHPGERCHLGAAEPNQQVAFRPAQSARSL